MSQQRLAVAAPRRTPTAAVDAVVLLSTEIDTRLLGMVVALGHHLDRLQHPVRRAVPDRPQPVEPVRPDGLGGDHGHGHGAHHRQPQHRPVGRVRARRRGHVHGADAAGMDPQQPRARLRPSGGPGSSRSSPGSSWAPLIGFLQGFLVAYVGIPSFVVTLGGLLVWRGFAWILASGRTISPLDSTFLLLGGGPKGSVGATVSWIIGIVVCVGI